MKAFLLAAGHGTRLRPLTDTVPKCLVPVRGVPLLRTWLELCAMHDITEVLVNVHAHVNTVREFVASETTVVKVTISEERELLGSAGTLKANRMWVADQDEFWILYADVLTSVNMTAMRDFHRDRDLLATLAVTEVPDPTRCGVVRMDSSGVITDFVEKPAVPPSNLAFSGVMLARRKFLDLIPEKSPADIGFDVLPQLVGNMAAYVVSDYLLDIGTLSNYDLAQRTWPGLAKRAN